MTESSGFLLMCGLVVGAVLAGATAALMAVAGAWVPAAITGAAALVCFAGAAWMAFGR